MCVCVANRSDGISATKQEAKINATLLCAASPVIEAAEHVTTAATQERNNEATTSHFRKAHTATQLVYWQHAVRRTHTQPHANVFLYLLRSHLMIL